LSRASPLTESALLNTIPLFHNLNDTQLASIGAHLALRAYEKGQCIFREGDHGDSLYVIVAGQVKVVRSDPDDPSREVILKTLGPGEFFGELPLFDQEPRSATVTTLERCHLQILSYRAFQRALTATPDIAQRVLETLAARLRSADRKMRDLALHDIASRVSRTLLELAIMSNGRRVVGEQFTQKDLANMVGASREMVNRTLRDLETGGYISIQRRSITILNDQMPV
jgi:CRP/FNR family transcriptional regulator, cyclic AMP receptor protein